MMGEGAGRGRGRDMIEDFINGMDGFDLLFSEVLADHLQQHYCTRGIRGRMRPLGQEIAVGKFTLFTRSSKSLVMFIATLQSPLSRTLPSIFAYMHSFPFPLVPEAQTFCQESNFIGPSPGFRKFPPGASVNCPAKFFRNRHIRSA